MSGHSKWKTIQHKKGAADAKRGKIFSKLSKELSVVARAGGGSPDMNPALRTLILKAKQANMPAENVDRAIKKGTGEIEGVTYEEIQYEGFAAGGIGVVVKVLTDNKNRSASEIRHIFSKHGSSFAAQGSVSRGFRRRGQILVTAEGTDEEKLMEAMLDAGGEDVQRDGDVFEILTDPAQCTQVAEALKKAGFAVTSEEVGLVPETYVPVTDKNQAGSVMRFVEELEDHDDVQNVYTNIDVDDSVLATLDK